MSKQLLHHRDDFKEGTVAGYPLILCPECGSELEYSRYVGFMNGDAYQEYDCTNPECNFTGRIFKENIYVRKLSILLITPHTLMK